MRVQSVLLLALALALPSTAAFGITPEPQRYIVGFYEMPDLAVGDRYMGERIVDLDAVLAFVVVETLDLVTFEERARSDDNVRYVEWNDPEFGRTSFVPNDAQYNNAGHYGSKKIGAETAWDRTLGSTTVKVAVIDSGILATHEEFVGGRVLAGWDAIDEDSTPQDTCGHGSHVAGTIAATINNAKGLAGLAQVTVYPIRGLTSTALVLCSGSTADLAQGLRIARDQGAHISSNSWGGGSATAITDAINYAHAGGVAQIAAAGNDGSCTNCVSEPWKTNAAKVIVVSSTDSNDAFSSFSSQGSQVDVAAPGTSIYSAYNSGNSGYSTLSGTSMATPHVAGTAALIKTLNPSWGYTEIDDRLKTTALDLGTAGKDDKFGYGRINAAAATASSSPAAPGAPTLSGTAGDAQVSLSWTTPANNGAAITAYKVYRDNVLRATLGVVNAYTDTGLTNGVARSYQVSAVNSVGEGARSNAVSLTPSAGNTPPTACFTHSESGLTTSVNGGCSSDAGGSIASWSWGWGDGAPASGGSSASHSYASAGTYTVTLTVTDNLGATGSTSQSVTVTNPSDPDPGALTLTNGVAKSDTSGAAGSAKFYKISVPTGKSQLQVVLDGPACSLLSCPADLDLYVRKGARPTDTLYDCRPFEGDSDETCTLANPGADWWYIRVLVYSGSNGAYTIKATY